MKCVDFSVTFFIYHIIICCIYESFPWNGEFWLIIIISLCIMAFFGERFCLRLELEDIPVDSHGRAIKI